MAIDLTLTIASTDRTAYLERQGMRIVKSRTGITGRADFVLLNFKPSIGDSVQIDADASNVFFQGVVRGITTTEHETGSGDYFCHVTAYDTLMGTYVEVPSPVSLSDVAAATAYTAMMGDLSDTWDSWWRLAEASGTTVTDEMAAHNLTYVNSPTLGVSGPLNNGDTAVTLNGSNQGASATIAGGIIAGTTHQSVSAWFKTSYGAADQVIYSERDASDGGQQICRVAIDTNGRPTFRVRGTSGSLATASLGTGNWADGVWHHVLIAKTSSTNVDLYVDGIWEGSVGISYTDTYSGIDTVTVGYDYYAGDHFNGSLAQVSVAHGTDLTYDDAKRLYTAHDILGYVALAEDITSDGTTTTTTYTITSDHYKSALSGDWYGAAPGMTMGVTSTTFALVHALLYIQEVETVFLNRDYPRLTLTMGDTPIRLASAFP